MHHRLELDGPADKITDLAATFDHMWTGLQHVFAAHRNFAANKSHELQTPLATTRVLLDVALSYPWLADWEETGAKLRDLNKRSTEITDALLDLTVGANEIRDPETVDLGLSRERCFRPNPLIVGSARKVP